jgi:hypothetical protein
MANGTAVERLAEGMRGLANLERKRFHWKPI